MIRDKRSSLMRAPKVCLGNPRCPPRAAYRHNHFIYSKCASSSRYRGSHSWDSASSSHFRGTAHRLLWQILPQLASVVSMPAKTMVMVVAVVEAETGVEAVLSHQTPCKHLEQTGAV